MHEIERQVLLELPPVFGVDLSITNEVLLLWLAALATFALLTAACRRRRLVPTGAFRNFFEAVIDFVNREVVQGSIGPEGGAWGPFILTLFFFILVSNLLGLVPIPTHFQAATANINVTAGFALIVFVTTVGVSLRRHGPLGFLKQFLPPDLPVWVSVLVVPVEIVSWLAKPLSLAVRLFANMMVGHALILVFVGLAAAASWLVRPLPLAGAVVMSAFEIFVCFVQAFIFAMLAGIYIREAMETH